ncbi:MAG TPA: hypothetical protein PK158_13895 [Spirochaetota bacterium]|nr:hypothetical protein [Spirochaetota bacterium]
MKLFKKFVFLIFAISVFSSIYPQRKDIPVEEVPFAVIKVLNQYLKILSESPTLEDCAKNIYPLLGGGLLSSNGKKVSSDTIQFSLKKDYNNVKFYSVPAEITRIQLNKNSYDGFEKTYIEGDIYKIWVKKKEGVAGMPAPIPVIVPKNDPEHPKVISTIGSL